MIKNNNRGFTLIEILLVVGFIALASVGVYTIYAKVSAGNQANAESRNLDTFKAGIQTLYAVGKNYASITNIVVNAARITPDNMKTSPTSSDGTITNSFSGEVTVLPVSLGAGTANGFEITYSKVPGNVCSKLVTTGGNQYDRITVGGTEVKAFGTNKFQEDAAAIACNGAPSEGITIKFASL
jgi:prepilin-type N-terminal cleavage/methylation domain-containing protein